MKKNYRNPMTRPENFMNPAGNVMKEIKEADLNNLGADNLSAPEEKMAEIIYDEIMREDSLFVWLHE